MEKLSRKDFNKKYLLNDSDVTLLKFYPQDKFISLQRIGKPTTRAKDIAKRFFTNPWTLMSLVLVFVVLLMSVIIPIISPFNANRPISEASSVYVVDQQSSLYGAFWSFQKQDFIDLIRSVEKNSGQKIILDIQESIGDARVLYDPYTLLQVLSGSNEKLVSIIGTDNYGRDIWLRIWEGTRNALWFSLLVVTITTLLGVPIGLFLGFHVGKRVDTLTMRVVDIINTVPSIIWLIVLIAIFGIEDHVVFGVLVFIGFTGPLEVARMYIITVKDEEFLQASKSLGATKARIIYIEALPLILGKLSAMFVNSLMSGVFYLSSLSFLGFISDSINADPNLGLSLFSSKQLMESNPWSVVLPSVILLTLVTSLKLISIGIHDALDPKAKKGV
ncbi:ABC transporter permease [Mycoplasma iguanae]|uniref:ABC transporter permease n=1 Tax=Mycoplasma iguanae TaxID=292461 RepID=A0ABY5R849_9MOLU|nr:ABC transporter permease [Mycoplasma iguanae]UVD81683.1 ABC transporter permease [Mycoplasma iguanae]